VSREKPRNLAASVRQRLFNLAQERHEDFVLVLTRYGLERFLYRLAQSQYRDPFILKGALLFAPQASMNERLLLKTHIVGIDNLYHCLHFGQFRRAQVFQEPPASRPPKQIAVAESTKQVIEIFRQI